MTLATKLIGYGALAVVSAGTWFMSKKGVGTSNLHNSAIMKAPKECPDSQRDASGKCPPKTYRSYFLVRTHRGGGFGQGGK